MNMAFNDLNYLQNRKQRLEIKGVELATEIQQLEEILKRKLEKQNLLLKDIEETNENLKTLQPQQQ